MESDDKMLAKTLGETGGLGTVATRADIIEKLFSSFLLEKKGKEIWLTSKAKQLLELVPEDLKKPDMTAQWEMRLSAIAKGRESRTVFMKEIRSYSEDLISEIKKKEPDLEISNIGEADFIITFKNKPGPGLVWQWCKIIFVGLAAFFGAACGEWKERKTARLPGQRMRIQGDCRKDIQCTLPGLP